MLFRTTCAAIAVALAATSASAQNVNTDSDPSAPFSTYKTYAWTEGTPSPNPLGEQRIHSAVDAQLAGRGLTAAQPGGAPDVYVATHVLTQQQQQLVANGFGPWAFGGGFGTIDVRTFVQGTLIVDVYDAKTRKMVWRGVATGTASDKASKNTAKVEKALAKMFQRYPPASN